MLTKEEIKAIEKSLKKYKRITPEWIRENGPAETARDLKSVIKIAEMLLSQFQEPQ